MFISNMYSLDKGHYHILQFYYSQRVIYIILIVLFTFSERWHIVTARNAAQLM